VAGTVDGLVADHARRGQQSSLEEIVLTSMRQSGKEVAA
jgi:hypothetical protein